MSTINRSPIKLWLAGILIACLLWLVYFKLRQFQRDHAFFAAIKRKDVIKARELVEHGAQWQTFLSKLHQPDATLNRKKLASTALQVTLEYYYDSSVIQAAAVDMGRNFLAPGQRQNIVMHPRALCRQIFLQYFIHSVLFYPVLSSRKIYLRLYFVGLLQ